MELSLQTLSAVNYAIQQNRVAVVRRVSVKNDTSDTLKGIRMTLTFNPGFAETWERPIDTLEPKGEIWLDDVDLKLSTDFFFSLTEQVTGTITLRVCRGEEVLAETARDIVVLTFDQWSGVNVMPELIASFVTPNIPEVEALTKRASELLGEWTGDASLDNYLSRNVDRVKQQMAALYAAISEKQIAYATLPPSYHSQGQRIRLCDKLIANRLGNCIEMSLLYASCLEAMGLRPLIAIMREHALVGCWLVADTFADSVNDDVSLITKRIAPGINEVLMVESTLMCAGNLSPFDAALESADNTLMQIADFELFVDVFVARANKVYPLPLRATVTGYEQLPLEDGKYRFEAPKLMKATDIIVDSDNAAVTKQVLWERKLLDLSLRNNLLNTRISKSSLQLISVKINQLEDALAKGEGFSIYPKPSDWTNSDTDSGIYMPLSSNDPMVDFLEKEQSAQRLRAYQSEDELKKTLTKLYRASRLSIEENGANTLYLALGLLKWYETNATNNPHFAPILLLPVEIVRTPIQSGMGYLIRSRDEEVMLNITLVEMLRQLFDLNITTLDPLPRDEFGIDVPLVFNTLRRAVKDRKGWDVVEQSMLGIFSFSKFIMWNDIHNNSDKLLQNPIVASLVNGQVELDENDEAAHEGLLDEQFDKEDVVLPISADSSQMIAICDALRGKSFVLHGPPGTGKSQTITNIIANALYHNKRVLFVAEKMAALQVVQRRLESIGLGPFCLELHSNKAKKSSVLSQLQRITEVVRRQSSENYALQTEKLREMRRELNDYVGALHKQHQAGLSLYDCIARYMQYDNDLVTCDLGTHVATYTPATIDQQEELLETYKTMAEVCTQEDAFKLAGIGLKEFNPAVKEDARAQLEALLSLIAQVEADKTDVETSLSLSSKPLNHTQFRALASICKVLLDVPVLPSQLFLEGTPELLAELQEAIALGRSKEEAVASLSQTFDTKILAVDPLQWQSDWKQADAKWVLSRTLQQNRLLKALSVYAQPGVKIDKEEVPQLLELLDATRKQIAEVDALGEQFKPLVASLWNKGLEGWNQLSQVCESLHTLYADMATYTDDFKDALTMRQQLSTKLSQGVECFRRMFAGKLTPFIEDADALDAQVLKLETLLAANLWDMDAPDWLEMLRQKLQQWYDHIDQLHDWAIYNVNRDKLAATDSKVLVEAVEEGRVNASQVVEVFRKSLYKCYANHILAAEPRLNMFHKVDFEEKIRRYAELCGRYEQLTRDEIVAKLSSSLPALQKEASQSSEVGILQRNIRNGGRGMSIRRLFDQLPDLLPRLCPCMLMSPISVAQYIEAGGQKFDLVIFDEASQMPTCEAVGAIARGNHLIVVGDPNQMPPTNFFAADTFDEDNADKEDLESILDDCLALSIPSNYLKWHYRSKHESLIAFSNVKYYENQLLTFPSPDDLANKVTFQYVEGLYDRGGSRQNRAEAVAVVEEIRQRLSQQQQPMRSIGVVTFNTNQQSLIEDLLTEMLAAHPELEAAAMECEEPIFVKNLENVQGDERDVILFSVGFGPDKQGRVALNFGPLNRDGGWRRLNVAVSRARYEMKVFSTLRSDDIDLNRTNADGVAGLKSFLEYAEKGRDALFYNVARENQSDDGFVAYLAEQLRGRGYDVHTHIGCSGYKVDVAVVDPHNPDKYVLGIVCDGYNYRNAQTTRDREITQPGVLRVLGWTLHHEWSMDWWEHPQKSLDALCAVVDSAIEGTLAAVSEAEAETEAEAEEEDRQCVAEQPLSMDYTCADLAPMSLSCEELCSGNHDADILQRMTQVVEAESPISRSLLYKRIIESYGIARMLPRIANYFDALMPRVGALATGTHPDLFFWRSDSCPDTYEWYRPVSERDAKDIAPQEVANALCFVLREQGSLPQDDLLLETAKVFGFSRRGSNVTAAMLQGLAVAQERRMVEIADGKVRVCAAC